MNLRTLIYCCLAAVGVMLSGCSSDSDDLSTGDSKPVKNEFIFDGESYRMLKGNQYYRGEAESGKNIIGLQLISEGEVFTVDFYVCQARSKELEEGNYTYNAGGTLVPGTFNSGVVMLGDNAGDIKKYNIIGGAINVSMSKNKFVVDVDCQCEGSVRLKGNYTGGLAWEDWSQNKSGNAM